MRRTLGEIPHHLFGEMKMESKWITDVAEIPDATDESLKRSLITLDGRGEKIKQAALNELLERMFRKGFDEGLEAAKEGTI